MGKKKTGRERLTSKESDEILGIPSRKSGESRRDRAKLRRQLETENELHGTTVENLKPRLLESTRHERGDSSKMLTDSKDVKSDIKLVEEAVSKGWNVRRKDMIRRRLEDIVIKTTGKVHLKEATIDCETEGDKISIQAAKVLTQMDKNDVERVKNSKPPEDTRPVVNVNVGIDARTTKYLELARSLGVKELTIDGRRVETDPDIRTVDSVPEGRGTTKDST